MTRDDYAARHDGYCPWCSRPLGDNFALHHRLLRSHGGTDSPANLVPIHHACHNLGTRAVHMNPSAAVSRGFIVRSGGDPAHAPLRLHGGRTVRLNEDGTVTTLEEARHGW